MVSPLTLHGTRATGTLPEGQRDGKTPGSSQLQGAVTVWGVRDRNTGYSPSFNALFVAGGG